MCNFAASRFPDIPQLHIGHIVSSLKDKTFNYSKNNCQRKRLINWYNDENQENPYYCSTGENRASARESWYQVSIQLTLVTLQKELDRAILEGNV